MKIYDSKNFGVSTINDNKYLIIPILALVIVLMYFGTTMFYNTGLTITDLNVQQSDTNTSEYDVSYMIRSVRGFNKVVSEYTLLTDDNTRVGYGSNELNEIKDGSFQIDDKVAVDDTSSEAKKIEIKLYEIDESNTQKEMFDQTFDI